MAEVRVKATMMGYFKHKRIRPEEEFFMDEKLLKFSTDGKLISPKWVDVVSDEPPTKNLRSKRNEATRIEDVI